jgi:UDP-N-acetylmuramyl-tripeptide synthetase
MLDGEQDILVLGKTNLDIQGLAYDSRNIKPKYVFFALKGNYTDGNIYIKQAIHKGACVIVTSERYYTKIEKHTTTVYIIVQDILRFMAKMSAKFYNYPDKMLNIIGITGTNGKTTITYMIESIFKNFGINCGVIGTINYRYAGKCINAVNTTPQSLDLYKIMREMVDVGVSDLIMEVSSHALSMGRVYGIEFNTAIFTNLTNDHLDFHTTLNNYFNAKSILFRTFVKKKLQSKNRYAIINADDFYGRKLLKIKMDAEIHPYSILNNNRTNWKITNIKLSKTFTSFNFIYHKVILQQIGLYNVYNAVAALIASICNNIPIRQAIQGIRKLKNIPGRLEQIDTKHIGVKIFIDYAHTVDALKSVLYTLRQLSTGKLITVFGCGGNRDKGKRAIMGRVAASISDFVIITSDNPRFEDPNQIVADIQTGIQTNKKNYKIILDRADAIKQAITLAKQGDIILIAGKGHEQYQIVKSKKIYFNDIEVVNSILHIN